MAEITESRLAMYEGIIALAWADHDLDANEKQELHALIDGNPRFTDEQRSKLHNDVDNKLLLKEVWSRVTEKRDRARILDMAHRIFLKDGKYCANEKELYDTFLAEHLETLDAEEMQQEVHDMMDDLMAQRKLEDAALKEYAKQFSLIESIKKLFD